MRIPKHVAHAGRSAIVASWLALLCACGGGGSSGDAGQGGGGGVAPPAPPPPSPPPPPPAATYTLGGTVTGLVGTGLILRNGTTELALAADGAFAFPVALTDGTAYDVSIAAQPSGPVQVCSIDNSSGAISGSAVTDIFVECLSTYEFLSSSPADGAVETTRAAQPLLTFSADLDAATATPAHVTLTSDAGEQPIDLSVAGSVLTIAPETKLLPLTEYTITVSTGLLSDAGEVLDSPVTTTFTTRDAEWLPQESLLQPAFGVRKVVSDAKGNTMVFWTEGAGGNRTFWSRYRAEDTGDWSAPMQVAAVADDHPISDLQMVFDGDGTGTVIWKRMDYGDPIELWTNRHVPGSGWGVAARIDTGTMEVGSFRAAGNGDGSVVMVWQQDVGSTTEMWASHFEPTTGWGAPEPIDVFEQLPPLSVLDAEMGLAVDADGNAIVTWQRRENDVYTIPKAFASRYEPASGWSPAEMLSASLTGFHGRPEVAMDASGNAIAIWRSVSAGTTSGVYASQYVRGMGWGDPVVIDAVSTADETPQVTFGPAGEAIAVWPQLQGSVIHAIRFDPGSGWGATEQINASGLGNAFFPRVRFDASGNALAVWQQLAPTMPLAYNIWSNRYTPIGGWSVAEMIGAAGDWFVEQMPLLRVDPSGDAQAIWVEFGAGEIWSARFE